MDVCMDDIFGTYERTGRHKVAGTCVILQFEIGFSAQIT